jgi:hypothetical protein
MKSGASARRRMGEVYRAERAWSHHRHQDSSATSFRRYNAAAASSAKRKQSQSESSAHLRVARCWAWDGTDFLVMEYLEGQHAKRLEKGHYLAQVFNLAFRSPMRWTTTARRGYRI